MADELLFDSERQEKKTQRRKWLFPALALAAVLLIAVAVARTVCIPSPGS